MKIMFTISKYDYEKPKRASLSVEQKCEILQRLEGGESIGDVAAYYRISAKTVYSIRRDKERILKIRNELDKCDGNSIMKKKYRGTEESELEQKLYEWFKQQRAMGKVISGPMIKKQARVFNARLNCIKNFTASDGFLRGFKKRHGLFVKTIHSEKLTADIGANQVFIKPFDDTDESEANPEYVYCSSEVISGDIATEDFIKTFQNTVKEFGTSPECIYNCDETGLYWKMMPNKTYVLQSKQTTSGLEKPKNRLTILLCTNATGTHKVPLFVVGKFGQPRCFKGIKSLPVRYTHQTNAWMTGDIFKNWYCDVFIPSVEKHHDLCNHPDKRIILLMDNARCHPSAEDLNELNEFCTVKSISPNATSLIQPLNQGIIDKFKRCYRSRFLSKLLVEDSHDNSSNYLKSYNLLDCCNFCDLGWSEITPSDIQSCWKRLVPDQNYQDSTPIRMLSNQEFHSLVTKISQYNSLTYADVETWLNIDTEETGWQVRSDEDLILNRQPDNDSPDAVTELEDDKVEYSDQNANPFDIDITNYNPTHVEALTCLETCVLWYQQNVENANSQIQDLRKHQKEVMDKLVKLRLTEKK